MLTIAPNKSVYYVWPVICRWKSVYYVWHVICSWTATFSANLTIQFESWIDFVYKISIITTNTAGVLYEAGTGDPSGTDRFTPGFWLDPCCSSFLFSVLCFCVLFVFVLCLMCPVLSVYLDCPFLIVPSVISNFFVLALHNYYVNLSKM